MAELEQGTRQLQWGRRPDGRFFVAVVTQAAMGKATAMLPLYVWTLTSEEEAGLKATLAGLVLGSNGHDALLASAVGGMP